MSVIHTQTQPLPSTGKLLKATAVAVAVAAVILVTTVLPAEYGVDPTGIGTRLGLNVLTDPAAAASASSVEPASIDASPTSPETPAASAESATAVTRGEGVYRQESMSITLAPGKGAEIKTRMNAGDAFVFHWAADGAVAVDMHGERVDAAKDEYTSYWIEREQSTASGTFTAPFEGSHGWYWLNRSDVPVTVKVDVSGFQQALYRP